MKFTDTNINLDLNSKSLAETNTGEKGFFTINQLKNLLANSAINAESQNEIIETKKSYSLTCSGNGGYMILYVQGRPRELRIYKNSTVSFKAVITCRSQFGDSAVWNISGIACMGEDDSDLQSNYISYNDNPGNGPSCHISKNLNASKWIAEVFTQPYSNEIRVYIQVPIDYQFEANCNIDISEINSEPINFVIDVPPVMWLDANNSDSVLDNSYLPVKNKEFISSWKDLSGNGFDANKVPWTSGPIKKENALNGKPVIAFVGLESSMTHALGLKDYHSIFIVMKSNHQSLDNAVFFSASNPEAPIYAYISQDTSGSGTWGTNRTAFVSSNQEIINDFKLVCLKSYGPSGIEMLTNSNNLGDNASNEDAYFNTLVRKGIGFNGYGSEPAACEIAEIICFDYALSEQETKNVSNYLNRKWELY